MQNFIYLATDHGGFSIKNKIKAFLEAGDYQVTDLGPGQLDPSDDYPDYGFKLAKRVAAESGRLGILICRSGVGMSIVSNKVKGIRAALCLLPEQAVKAREHNDANVLVLAADFTKLAAMPKIINQFLTTSFSGEKRHQRRLAKIKAYENFSPTKIN